jgi:hypothetical protein
VSQSAYPDLDQVRWLPALNISGDDIPPFGVVRLVSINDDGQFEVDYPDKANYPYGLAFNGPTTIPSGGAGSVTTDTPFWAHYDAEGINGNSADSSDDTPVAGDIWGPTPNSFALINSASGFRVLSSVDPFDLSACMVVLDPLALPDEPNEYDEYYDYYDGSPDSADPGDLCEDSGESTAGGGITIPFNACDADGNPCQKELVINSPTPLRWCIRDPNGCGG